MKISLCGPSLLTDYDKTEIRKYLEAVIDEHNISILAYRSIEKEIFKFFVENEQHASKLTIYTFPELDYLSEENRLTINYLKKCGATYKSFHFNDMIVKRSLYEDVWKFIMDENDAVMSFYDQITHQQEIPKLMIPIDTATALNKKSFVFDLPVNDETLLNRKPIEKIRLIQ